MTQIRSDTRCDRRNIIQREIRTSRKTVFE
ncbi:Uncharacterised protein [Vibrio cholerae]|nr:Uncharacterised protein [Vibrio cholerae]